MVSVIFKTENDEVVKASYDSVEALRKEYWSDSIDMDVPPNDAPVVKAAVDGKQLFDVAIFEDVIVALGIDKGGEKNGSGIECQG